MTVVRQAFILVGGRGTRLGAIAKDAPKPLMPIADGRVFLDFVIAAFARAGVSDIVLLAGHLAGQVEARYHGRPIGSAQIRVVREPEPAGTAGALALARDIAAPLFFMANGDSLFDFAIPELAATLPADAVGALALRRVEDGGRYGAVSLENGRITRFAEKDPSLIGPALINAGVYLLRDAVLKDIGPPPCSIETDVFPKLVARGLLAGAAFEGYFIDIGLPETLAQARAELPARF